MKFDRLLVHGVAVFLDGVRLFLHGALSFVSFDRLFLHGVVASRPFGRAPSPIRVRAARRSRAIAGELRHLLRIDDADPEEDRVLPESGHTKGRRREGKIMGRGPSAR